LEGRGKYLLNHPNDAPEASPINFVAGNRVPFYMVSLCLHDLVDRVGEQRGVHADQTRDHAGRTHVVVSQTRLQHDAGDRTGDVAHRQGIDIGEGLISEVIFAIDTLVAARPVAVS